MSVIKKTPRFIGIKNNFIHVVSDKEVSHSNLEMLPLPEEFENISSEDLIVNFRYSNNQLKRKLVSKPISKLKIAFVGNFKMRCGISTYNENLWPLIAKQTQDFKLFVEENDFPTGSLYELGDFKIREDQVSVCWKRGKSLKKLADEIKEYDPDIVVIAHEFGLFPHANHWLSFMSELSQYRLITIMHSVFHHKDKAICEAAMPEIIVHLEGAKKVLKEEKNLSSKVNVIHHGCFPPNPNKLWNIYRTEHTVIQTGFLFRYKSWDTSLRAIAILKEKIPDIFFTGICSESPFNMVEHQLYYNELTDLIEQLGISENVSLIRGYQSDNVLNNFMETNNIALFPYTSTPEHEVFGVSGAARLAMAKSLPIVSSKGNHFEDIPSIKCETAEEMAEEIYKLFSDKNLYNQQIAKQNEYLFENTWEKVAQQYIKIFEKF